LASGCCTNGRLHKFCRKRFGACAPKERPGSRLTQEAQKVNGKRGANPPLPTQL